MSSSRPPHLHAVPDLAPAIERELAAVRISAHVSTEHASRCWAAFVDAVEAGTDAVEAEHELQCAMAQQRYAWAVYHCAAGGVGVTPPG